jgi:hypothetical protein
MLDKTQILTVNFPKRLPKLLMIVNYAIVLLEQKFRFTKTVFLEGKYFQHVFDFSSSSTFKRLGYVSYHDAGDRF